MPITKKMKCCKNAEKSRKNLQSKEFKIYDKSIICLPRHYLQKLWADAPRVSERAQSNDVQ